MSRHDQWFLENIQKNNTENVFAFIIIYSTVLCTIYYTLHLLLQFKGT